VRTGVIVTSGKH